MNARFDDLLTVLLLAIAVAAVSVTTSKAKVFAGVRQRIRNRSEWFGELAQCPYCTSHWLSFLATAVYQPRVVNCGYLLPDLLVSAFAMVTLAALAGGLIIRSYSVGSSHEAEAESTSKKRYAA